MSRMELAYAPSLSDRLIARLEEAARGVGLPLEKTELLGQEPTTAAAFVESVLAGNHERFLERIDWMRLRNRLADRQPVDASAGADRAPSSTGRARA